MRGTQCRGYTLDAPVIHSSWLYTGEAPGVVIIHHLINPPFLLLPKTFNLGSEG